MNPNAPRVVVPSTTFRDAMIGGAAGLLVLAFLIYGIAHFASESNRAKANTLTGTVTEKQFTPAPQEEISVGSKGLKTKRIEGEYLLKVRVETEQRDFEVPVEKSTYESKVVGDSITFIRPPSEQ